MWSNAEMHLYLCCNIQQASLDETIILVFFLWYYNYYIKYLWFQEGSTAARRTCCSSLCVHSSLHQNFLTYAPPHPGSENIINQCQSIYGSDLSMTTQKKLHALRAKAGELNSYPTWASDTRELLCYSSKTCSSLHGKLW